VAKKSLPRLGNHDSKMFENYNINVPPQLQQDRGPCVRGPGKQEVQGRRQSGRLGAQGRRLVRRQKVQGRRQSGRLGAQGRRLVRRQEVHGHRLARRLEAQGRSLLCSSDNPLVKKKVN